VPEAGKLSCFLGHIAERPPQSYKIDRGHKEISGPMVKRMKKEKMRKPRRRIVFGRRRWPLGHSFLLLISKKWREEAAGAKE
jgi:hypothetical protein